MILYLFSLVISIAFLAALTSSLLGFMYPNYNYDHGYINLVIYNDKYINLIIIIKFKLFYGYLK